VDLGATKFITTVVRKDGRILASHRHLTPARLGPVGVIEELVSCIDGCLGPSARTAQAIGIGFAGQVDRRGVVIGSPNLGWRDVPLGALVGEATGLPVTVTNDARAITFGEWFYGSGRGVSDLICIYVGTGIGGGIVSDGRLRYGHSGTAGEVGHMTVLEDGRKCHCGNLGCLEAYAGGWAIAAEARRRLRRTPGASRRLLSDAERSGPVTAETVTRAARRGNAFARRLLEEVTHHLASGLVGVVNAFNPELLLLGGGVVHGYPSIVRGVSAEVRRRALPLAGRQVRVERADLGARAGVLGAAAMAGLGIPGGP
jgi:glucokinase